ncbi:MAG: tRNA (adenosine(37)-N6)-dimethylallyltransferase MiaA [Bacteroidetes bacterium]|jgi:tRNA dimethylallyltransferase|nr:tRNA (adenosine(37)-N6)-dimethylallyltransferase MiaA [Bacteroidota bacterium]
MQNKHLIIILGPTAVGKTNVAIHMARAFETQIISADSRQIYREMSVGTAVPSAEELQTVPHHFIQERSVTEYYNASMYEQDVLQRLENLYKKHDVIVMSGGTGLYIDTVCKGIDDLPDVNPELRKQLTEEFEKEGIESLRQRLNILDPEYYKKVDLNNAKRLLKAIEISLITGKPYSSLLTKPSKKRYFNILKIGLNIDRETLYNRINARVDQMIKEGLETEARNLVPHRNINALNTVGYKEFFDFFEGHHTREKAIELIKRNTRRYARRQLTWFKKDTDITWFQPDDIESIKNHIHKNITG